MVSTALLIIIYLSFVSLGLPDSVLGCAWPTMAGDLRAPLWGAGLIQMTVSLCTIISSLNSARLIRRFGTGRLTAFSVVMTAAALMGMSFAPHYVFLLLLGIPLGLGAGAVDAAMNNYVALHCEAKHMNWLHCFWGVGTVISPMILSALLASGFTWKAGYRGVSLIQAALSVLLFATLHMWGGERMQAEERGAKVLSVREVLALPGAKQGLLNFTFYCAAEQTFMVWSATFMVMARGVDAVLAASLGALFFVGMTAGRGASGFIAMRLKPRQMVRLGQALMAAACLMLLVPVRALSVAGLLLMGLGCAPVYPNIVQDTPRNYGAENSQAVIGVQMAFAYIGSLFAPTIFGWIAEIAGYGALPAFAFVLTAVSALLFDRQQRIVSEREKNAEKTGSAGNAADLVSDCQKRIFDSLVDGGASSPATTTPTRFYLKPSASGRKICKETIFLLENGIFRQKNRCGRDVHAVTPDFIFRSAEVFRQTETGSAGNAADPVFALQRMMRMSGHYSSSSISREMTVCSLFSQSCLLNISTCCLL